MLLIKNTSYRYRIPGEILENTGYRYPIPQGNWENTRYRYRGKYWKIPDTGGSIGKYRIPGEIMENIGYRCRIPYQSTGPNSAVLVPGFRTGDVIHDNGSLYR